MLRRVLEPPQRRADLTLPQMRVLAAVAVHQPATRGEIAHVLVQSEVSPDILDALEERGFVRPGPRRMTPGRPATWVTTPLFLDHFGLATPEDIPGLAEMHAAGMLDRERLEREMRATRLAREE
jgi:segregation and condensation protein B